MRPTAAPLLGLATLTLFAGSQYYNESWTVLALIMMAGLMDDLTLPPP